MPLDPRHNRLLADYEKLLELQAGSPFVRILETSGNPPDKYVLLLKSKGITALDASGRPQFSEVHRLSIELPATYPRNIPLLKMLTPVWHPNISLDQGWICMGHEGEKGYAPSMSLQDLVLRIIEIIRYENYSQQYYLNQKAFEWAKHNASLFPLDRRQIMDAPLEIKLFETIADQDLLGEINIL